MTYAISILEKRILHFVTRMKIAAKDHDDYTVKLCRERIEELDKAVNLLMDSPQYVNKSSVGDVKGNRT